MGDGAVLVSIRSKCVDQILNGEKVWEIRKRIPDLRMPFRVYIYCTKRDPEWWLAGVKGRREAYRLNGTVCAEFLCDEVWTVDKDGAGWMFRKEGGRGPARYFCDDPKLTVETGLTQADFDRYLGTRIGYAWHISDLKVYDQPRKVAEFRYRWCIDRLKKAPESFCYVEVLDGL